MPRHPIFSLACAAFLTTPLAAADIPFFAAKDVANGTVSGLSCVDAGRIDSDALPDVVCVEGGKHAGGRRTLAWFRSPADPQGSWTRHEINPSAPLRSFLGAAKLADFDNDGDLDLVVTSDNHSGGSKQADVSIFVNPGGAASSTWSYQRVTPTTLALHHINDIEIIDLDGDGRKDIICRSLEPNQIHIFFQNSMSSWTRRTLDTGISASEGLSVGRIDGDHRPDITFSGWWFQTPSDVRNGAYAKRPIDSDYQNVNQNTKESTGDIDGDGLIDIVIGPAEAYRNGGNHVLAWYRNPGSGYTSNWTRTVIKANTNNHHTVKLADMDGDGDLDVVTGKPWSATGIPKESVIFFNDGSGGFASSQAFVSGKGLYTAAIVDIGNDGDLDIVGQDSYAGTSKPWLYESKLAGTTPPPPPPADTQAPTVPGNLRSTAVTATSVALAWNTSTDNVGVTAYEISRNGSVLATVNGTSHTSTGLTPDTAYAFAVRARDAAGNWSAPASLDVTTQADAPATRDAFARIEAESYDGMQGIGIYNGGTGQKIGSIENGTWARYDGVDFGSGASSCAVRGSSNSSGGTIEFRLGSTTGTLIGSCVVPGTGGWNNFVDLSCPISGASGVQTLYLVFTGGGGALLDVDYLQFAADTTPPPPPPPAPTDPVGTWQITLAGSTQALEIMGTANYADLQIRPDDDRDEQTWMIRAGTSAGWYEVINVATGKALECWASNPAEGDEITQYTINRKDWQQWKFTQQADGTWRIEGKHNPRSVTAGTSTSGANVDARADIGAATQRWNLVPPGPAAPSGNG